ncbi:MAG: DISARM system phospholipase D-like protein DrmC [Acidimicrobiaceae bacterium]|nr:DISARM system phospholipase D-like protein DrmC [Acidimicrobiaceae bacterium]
MNDLLTDAIVEAAIYVPEELLTTGVGAIADVPGWSPASQSVLIDANPAVNYREHAQKIAQAWAHTPEVTGATVAAAASTAAATAATMRTEHDTSLVWTGPSTQIAGLRSTRSVLTTLVTNATQSLILVSFTTHDVGELTASLVDAIAKGVEVILILETPDDPGGRLVFGPDHPFNPIQDTARFYRWPQEIREAFFATTARLHAKCVIADQSSALITSANLTSAGINDNIELGVLIKAGPLPARLSRHLELLIEQGTLEPA